MPDPDSCSRWTSGPRRCSCTRARGSGCSGSRSAPGSIYPPESLPGVKDVERRDPARAAATRSAREPLPELLHAGMRLTIAFDDISLPLPPMRTPDIRQRIIEHVLELAAAPASTTSSSIVANALHRRMTADEIKRDRRRARVPLVLARRRSDNFDAEDRDEPDRTSAQTDHGEDVEITEARGRVRPARLRQHQPGRDGRRPQVGGDRARRRTSACKHHHNIHTMLHSQLVHGPARGPQRDATTRHGGWAGCSPRAA